MITIKAFTFNSFQVNCYVLHDETKEAIIIDPAFENSDERDLLFNYIESNKLKPQCIANTHGHIDHILGVEETKSHFNIPFWINENDVFLLTTATQSAQLFGFDFSKSPVAEKNIDENDVLSFGESQLQMIHVPGHSPGSIVFYAPLDKFIIAGDVLFKSSIGRSDLPGGNHEQLISGIKSKLMILPKETAVYSGHGPGSTIGFEHDTNPFLI